MTTPVSSQAIHQFDSHLIRDNSEFFDLSCSPSFNIYRSPLFGHSQGAA